MDQDQKTKLDDRLKKLEARARARKRMSLMTTLASVLLTGVVFVFLVREVANKGLELTRLEDKARSLEGQVSEKRKERERLEAENKQLEERQRSLRQFIEGQHERPSAPHAVPGEPPPSVVVSEEGAIPDTFVLVPRVEVEPEKAPSARGVMGVRLSLDVPEAHRALIESVTYDLNKDSYKKNQFVSEAGPSFAVEIMVYDCVGTVLATVKLKNGSIKSVAFEWCKENGWPPKDSSALPEPSALVPYIPIRPPGRPPGIVPLPRK
jgi:TolA-binding protein